MLETVNKLDCFEKDNLVTVPSIDVVTKKPYIKTIWKDKISKYDMDNYIRDVSHEFIKIKSEEDIKNDKIIPFWNDSKANISNSIWMPSKLDITTSIILQNKKENFYSNINHSWFSIDEKSCSDNNLNFNIPDFSFSKSLDPMVNKPKLKTLVILLKPSEEEKVMLDLYLNQYRWYYNAGITIIYKSYGEKNIKNHTIKSDFEQKAKNPKHEITYDDLVLELKEKELNRKIKFLEDVIISLEKKESEAKRLITNKDLFEGDEIQENIVKTSSKEEVKENKKTIQNKLKTLSEGDIVKENKGAAYSFEEITPDTEVKYNSRHIRDNLLCKYKYVETESTNEDGTKIINKDIIFNPDQKEVIRPPWWEEGQVPGRIPRGALDKVVSSLNSAVSNYKAGNNDGFKMRYKSVNDNQYCHFEDKGYPQGLLKIKSQYWYTEIKKKNNVNQKKRKRISFKKIVDMNTSKKGLEIIYEKTTGRYFIHYPVVTDWYPEDDKRFHHQGMFTFKGKRIISLDPGIRKFMVGYDPQGKIILIGEGVSSKILELYGTDDPDKFRKIKNHVKELHHKTINYLIKNYDTILLPEFNTSQMLKGKNLSRMTKYTMQALSFYAFKQRLKYKCALYGKELIIVNESYTSCTCTGCGFINSKSSKEVLTCERCTLTLDRDIKGSRNIFIKNSILRIKKVLRCKRP